MQVDCRFQRGIPDCFGPQVLALVERLLEWNRRGARVVLSVPLSFKLAREIKGRVPGVHIRETDDLAWLLLGEIKDKQDAIKELNDGVAQFLRTRPSF